MTPGRIAWLAVVAVVCVLGIFFFPVRGGPYSAVHGPVTALLSLRAAARLRMAIVLAGLSAVRSCLDRARFALLVTLWTAFPSPEFRVSSVSDEFTSVLRC